jgi:small subunit ribosomal protein S10
MSSIKAITVHITLKAFHPFYLNRFVVLTQEKLTRFGILKVSNVFLPSKIERFTVLRSPHVDKKARDQFERVTHKRILVLKLSLNDKDSLQYLHRVLSLLKSLALGAEISVKYIIKGV